MTSSRAPAHDPPTYEGSVVAEKFRLERVLGEGGMGVVYAAVHLDLCKHVAIKIIRDELATRADVVERMLNEARSAAQLRSEHVAQVLDVGRLESGAPFIVMEQLDGADLSVLLLERGRFAPALAVSYMLQACEAVAEAHAVGIVHRDVKPENLFVAARADGGETVKVLDFGIAKNLCEDQRASLTSPSTIVGSLDYMSPEAMRSTDDVGVATDIWSIGAVLYELISGLRPFTAQTVPETCARVLSEEPDALSDLVPDLPRGLEAIIMRCLRKEPSARFQSVAELAQALAPFGLEDARDLAERTTRVSSRIRLKSRMGTPSGPISARFARESTSPLSVSDHRRSSPNTPKRPRRLARLASTAFVVVSVAAAAALTFGLTRRDGRVPSEAHAASPPAEGSTATPAEKDASTKTVEHTLSGATDERSAEPEPKRGRARAKPAAPRGTQGSRSGGSAKPSTNVSASPDPGPAPATSGWDPSGFGGRR